MTVNPTLGQVKNVVISETSLSVLVSQSSLTQEETINV